MGEDNKNLKELHIIDGATGKEIPCTPIKNLEFCEKEGEFEENLDKWFLARDEDATLDIDLDKKSFLRVLKMFRKIEKEFDKKTHKKSNRLLPLTKKRTKKILMSRGYSRNDANRLLEDIDHRTMLHLDKFFPKV